MASTLNSTNFMGEKYELTLNQSIQALLDSVRHNPEKSQENDFTSVFTQLMQSKLDSPLESIWVYSALAYLDPKGQNIEPLEQFSATKDLFQLISSCSACCNPLKSIVLIAPVVYNLHKFMVDLKGFELGLKREKKLKREIKGLVSSILGYVNVCCDGLGGSFHGGFEGKLMWPLKDLVSIWFANAGEENGRLEEFFPLLGCDFVESFGTGECGVSELAGFVITEVFLLKLCVELWDGNSKKVSPNELRSWVVGSISGFRNSYLFWTLLMMLLEPVLPVAPLLDSKDEIFLRKLLYDAVVLVEYSFLNAEGMAKLPAKHGKRVAISRLMVIHEAIVSLRELGEEHTKAILYETAFSGSALPSQLLQRVRCGIGIDVKANGPNGTSPKAFLRWILNLENRGLRIFDDDMSKIHAKLMLANLTHYPEQPVYEEDRKNSDADADLHFYIDKKGEEEEGEDREEEEEEEEEEEDEKTTSSINAAFMAVAHSMLPAKDGRLKRKAKDVGKKKGVKSLKHGRPEDSDSADERSGSINDESSSDSEVDNPSSSDEEDTMDQ